jgi:WD40 repeat protein
LSSRRVRTKTAKLWDAASGKLMASFHHEDEFCSLTGEIWNDAACSSNGARILTASDDKTAKLWDAGSGKLLASFAHEEAVTHVAF